MVWFSCNVKYFSFLIFTLTFIYEQTACANWMPSNPFSDETFSSYSTNSHLPLKVLLGKPLYLEVLLNSPKPEATLLINYCVAYTRSGRNALVLLYEGYVYFLVGCGNQADTFAVI